MRSAASSQAENTASMNSACSASELSMTGVTRPSANSGQATASGDVRA